MYPFSHALTALRLIFHLVGHNNKLYIFPVLFQAKQFGRCVNNCRLSTTGQQKEPFEPRPPQKKRETYLPERTSWWIHSSYKTRLARGGETNRIGDVWLQNAVTAAGSADLVYSAVFFNYFTAFHLPPRSHQMPNPARTRK